MKRAEKIIRQQIAELSMNRIPFKRAEIEQAIKFMYWQGAFRKKKFEQMNMLLLNKYNDIMNKDFEDFMEQDDKRYKEFLQRYDINEP